MKKGICLLVGTLSLSGCYTVRHHYLVSAKAPYEDSIVSIRVAPNSDALSLSVENKTDMPTTLSWAESYITAPNGARVQVSPTKRKLLQTEGSGTFLGDYNYSNYSTVTEVLFDQMETIVPAKGRAITTLAPMVNIPFGEWLYENRRPSRALSSPSSLPEMGGHPLTVRPEYRNVSQETPPSVSLFVPVRSGVRSYDYNLNLNVEQSRDEHIFNPIKTWLCIGGISLGVSVIYYVMTIARI